jgi:hypothetical protein
MKTERVSDVVEHVLKTQPAAKRDLKVLMREVYRAFGHRRLDDIFGPKAPNPETIIRQRRKTFVRQRRKAAR